MPRAKMSKSSQLQDVPSLQCRLEQFQRLYQKDLAVTMISQGLQATATAHFYEEAIRCIRTPSVPDTWARLACASDRRRKGLAVRRH